MAGIIQINKEWYSREPFPTHTHRAKIEYSKYGEQLALIDVYTTSNDMYSAIVDLKLHTNKKSLKAISLKISSWHSKQEDEATTKFLDEWLKDIKP